MVPSVIPVIARRTDMEIDNRDEIIRTQMDVIGSLIDNNLRAMADDLWGDRTSVV